MHRRSSLFTSSTDHFEYLAVPNSATTAPGTPSLRTKPTTAATTSSAKAKTPLTFVTPLPPPTALSSHKTGATRIMFENPALSTDLHSRIYHGHASTQVLSALMSKHHHNTQYGAGGSRTPKKTSAVHYTSAHSGLAHSSSSSKLDSTPVNTPSTLSEENLKFHTRLTRNQPMSFVERISIWRQSLPDKYEDEEELRESIRRSSSARNQTTNSTITTSQSSPSYPTNTPHSKPASPSKSTRAMPDPARSSGRPTTVGGGAVPTRTGTATAGTYYSAAAVKKRYEEKGAHSAGSGSLFRPLPSLATLGGVPYAAEHEALELHGQQQRLGKKAGSGVHAEASIAAGGGVGNGAAGGVGASSSTAAIGGVASPTSRGKLLCCLKVEIKTGVFRMLPVHENDDAHELSLEFCKTNHLMNSVEALTNHVSLSKSTFTK